MKKSINLDDLQILVYNQIVEITGDNEEIDYDKIDALIDYYTRAVYKIGWSNAIEFAKENLK